MTIKNEFEGLLQIGWWDKDTSAFEFIAQASIMPPNDVKAAFAYLLNTVTKNYKDPPMGITNPMELVVITSEHPAFVKAKTK